MMSRRRKLGLAVSCMFLVVLTAAVALRIHQRSSWQADLAMARQAVAEGRLGTAREILGRLAGRWTNEGEVDLLLGDCELARGRREEAIRAWSRVPSHSPFFARAASSSATHLINSGRYSPAEDLLLVALENPPAAERYALERSLSRVYRFEGRFGDVRRVLRGAWGGSSDPAGVLKELWLLDHSPMPVAAWRAALEKGDEDDDRVWLGRANDAILTGDVAAAARWLDPCRERRPDDPAVWKASLDLAMAKGDPKAVAEAAGHLPVGLLSEAEVLTLRSWLAASTGDRASEQSELLALVKLEPGASQALGRLAALYLEAGDPAKAKEYHRLKAGIDTVHDRFRKIVLDDSVMLAQASELARLSATMGRPFDAAAWSIVDQARPSFGGQGPLRFDASLGIPAAISDAARALSSPFATRRALPGASTETLAARIADLLPSSRLVAADFAGPAGTRSSNPLPHFVDDAEAAGLDFLFDNGQTAEHLLPETMSGGVGLLDYDGDGWLDVYCVQGGPLSNPQTRSDQERRTDRLFRNLGNGKFKDVSVESGLVALLRERGYGLAVAVGDFDNDGHPDLFLSRLQTYVLLRNRGDRTFEDVTDRAGLSGRRDNPTSAAFADLDNDGDLDLYVCHYMKWDPENPTRCKNEKGEYFYCDPSKVEAAPDHVFRNDAGRFTDVTESAGFTDANGRGLGVVAADVDDDGRVDLFVSNDGTANYLFMNKGDFQFEDTAPLSGVAGNAAGGYQAGMGVACGDLDQDGRPDLMVTNFYGEGTTLYRNLGQGLFTDVSSATGLGLASRYLLGFGIALADLGNRGRLDVMITYGHVNDNRPYYLYAMPARVYQGRGDGGLKLVDISDQAGEPWQVNRVGRGLAAGDVDNDGRIDAILLAQNEPVAYFHNQTKGPGHHVTLELVGTRSNCDAVGARVSLAANGRNQVSARLGGGSYQSANDHRLHFGLGSATRVEQVEVHWPSGQVDRWNDLAADRGYRLIEGGKQPSLLPGFREP